MIGGPTHLPPALRLLAASCRWPADATRDVGVRAAADGFDDWDALLSLVERHRVAGLVQQSLTAAGVAMPQRAQSQLAAAARAIARKSLACSAETVRLQQLLDDAGIPVVFFKGVTLAAQAYDAIAIKHGKDVDCLVSTDDARRCVTLLEANGYRLLTPRPRLSPRQWRVLLRFDKELSLLSERTGVQIELHWRLTGAGGLLPTAPLVAAAVRDDNIAGRSISGFAPDDLFAYLCAHGAESGWCRLKWLADLNALTASASVDELARLQRHAERRGAGAAATLALALCAEYFGREIPEAVGEAMRRSALLRAMHAIVTANLRDPRAALPWHRDTPMFLLLAAAHGGVAAQLARSTVALDDAMRFPLPPPLYWFYPLLRLPFAFWRKARARGDGRAMGTPNFRSG
jgi:hypothetical protein